MTAPIDNTATADPTKWRDRIAEFGDAASASVNFVIIIGGGTTVVGTGINAVAGPSTVVGASAYLAAGAGAAFTAVVLVPVVAGAFAGDAVSGIGGGPARPRPLARKLGRVFPGLTGLAVGSFAAYNIASAPLPPAQPVSTAPEAVFNITADNCNSPRVQHRIEQIKADGFPVNCAKPSGP